MLSECDDEALPWWGPYLPSQLSTEKNYEWIVVPHTNQRIDESIQPEDNEVEAANQTGQAVRHIYYKEFRTKALVPPSCKK